MDLNFINNNIKGGNIEKSLYNYAPNLASASHRLQKYFFKSCPNQINLYEACLGLSW